MSRYNISSKGLTLIEILVATMILLIIVAAAYATFISITRISMFSRNELEAYQNASIWLEEVRTGANATARYNNLTATAAPVDLNDAASVLQHDYTNAWPLAGKANVSNLDAAYTIEDTDLGSGAPYEFKKITMTVNWTEEE